MGLFFLEFRAMHVHITSVCQSAKANVPVYCGRRVFIAPRLLTRVSYCCSSHHHLTSSQRILATVTLLTRCLRQQSTKLPSSITLFIYTRWLTRLWITPFMSQRISINGANHAGYLGLTAVCANIPFSCCPMLHFNTNAFVRQQTTTPSCFVQAHHVLSCDDKKTCHSFLRTFTVLQVYYVQICYIMHVRYVPCNCYYFFFLLGL